MLSSRNKRAVVAAAFVLATAVATSAIAVGASSAPGASAVGLRATLTSSDIRADRGFFVGSLRVRTLKWSLAYRGLIGSRLVAQIHLGTATSGGPVVATLCKACPRPARGRSLLSQRVVQAIARQRAYVEVHDRTTAGRQIAGTIAVASIPTLEILAPKEGETLQLPADISYRITGLDLDQAKVYLAVYVAGSDGRRLEIPLPALEGKVSLPDAKDAFLVGHRNLTFQLATAEHVLVPNPEAIVIVRDLTLEGRRVG